MLAARRFFHSRKNETRDQRGTESRVGANVISIFIKKICVTRYHTMRIFDRSCRQVSPLDSCLFMRLEGGQDEVSRGLANAYGCMRAMCLTSARTRRREGDQNRVKSNGGCFKLYAPDVHARVIVLSAYSCIYINL
jgi:hypothetical protein